MEEYTLVLKLQKYISSWILLKITITENKSLISGSQRQSLHLTWKKDDISSLLKNENSQKKIISEKG